MTYSEAINLIKQLDIAEAGAIGGEWDPDYIKGYAAACCLIREVLLDRAANDENGKNDTN